MTSQEYTQVMVDAYNARRVAVWETMVRVMRENDPFPHGQGICIKSHEQNNPPPDNQEKTITQSNEDEAITKEGENNACKL